MQMTIDCGPRMTVASSRARTLHAQRVRHANKLVADPVDAEVLADEIAAAEARFLADAARAAQAEYHDRAAALTAATWPEVRAFNPSDEPARSPLRTNAPNVALAEG